MSYASTLTMIPLARVADVLQIDPYHFHSIYTSNRPMVPSCPDDWYQHDWQDSGKLSRESMALALRQAEDAVVNILGFSLIPRWYDEYKRPESYYKPEMFSLYNSKGRAKSITANYGLLTEQFSNRFGNVFAVNDRC